MSAPAPRVWVLLGKGAGGNGQMKSLAEALGWPCEVKQLQYNRFNRLPNLLLGASLLSLDRPRSSPLTPPWPDLVIAGSRRSAPVARWIKRQSLGRARLVHLMHTMAPFEPFDLIITTPQYRLPERPNILHNTVPLNVIPAQRLQAGAAAWAPRLAALPRPFTALLVGGDSSSYAFDAATAARLGREASARVRASGGALLLTTSARTSPAATDALIAAVDCPASCYRWRADDPDNPYHAFLALADRFIVTVDSASLPAEACAMGKPVEVFEWPRKPDKRRGVKRLVRRAAEAPLLFDRLLALGLIKPRRDFDAFRRALAERGLLSVLGADAPLTPPRPLDDMERALTRVRALFAAPAAGAESRAA